MYLVTVSSAMNTVDFILPMRCQEIWGLGDVSGSYQIQVMFFSVTLSHVKVFFYQYVLALCLYISPICHYKAKHTLKAILKDFVLSRFVTFWKCKNILMTHPALEAENKIEKKLRLLCPINAIFMTPPLLCQYKTLELKSLI